MSKSSVQPIPEGFHTITPYVMVDNVENVIEFAKKAFDAKEIDRLDSSDGSLMHACLQIGDSRIMFSPSCPINGAFPANIYLYVKDANASYQKAVNAGAKSIQEPKDMFYGDHSGGVKDAGGNMWWVATKVENVAPDELKRRAHKEEEKMKAMSQKKAA